MSNSNIKNNKDEEVSDKPGNKKDNETLVEFTIDGSILEDLKQRITVLENKVNDVSVSEKILDELEAASEKVLQRK